MNKIFAIFSKYWWFQTKWFTRLLEFIKLYKQNPLRFFIFISLPIVPKKLQPAFGYRLQKNPLCNQKNQTGLWNYDYFPTIQWRPHLIWPNNHKDIWIFVKQVTGPFFKVLSLECTWMYVASTGRLCSQKTGSQTYSNFMHTFVTKVVPDNLKPCQICKIM